MRGTSIGPVPVIAVLLATGFVAQHARRWWRRRRLRRLIGNVTRHHLTTLSVKRRQLEMPDGYGNVDLGAWDAHLDYFIGNVVLREARARRVSTAGLQPDARAWEDARAWIGARVERSLEARRDAGGTPASMTGAGYEALCADRLRDAGWRVSTTPATGDQGADLIAERGGRRVVLQCKFHARPVGNKAVQEAFAALPYHGGDRAAVVSNAAFTRAARQLARTNGVALLHHDALAELPAILADAEGGSGAVRARGRGAWAEPPVD